MTDHSWSYEQDGPRVEVSGQAIMIDVVVVDPVVASMLGPIEQLEERAECVADMLEVGARVIQREKDGAQGELLRREVDRMRETLALSQRELVDVAGADFATAVTQVMTRVSEQLAAIGGRLDGALAVADRQAQVDVERQRGTAKGVDFEARVAEEIATIAKHNDDVAEHVGAQGSISGRVGDVVVDVGAATGQPQGRIVFECKAGRISRPEAMRQLDAAIEQRSASIAVLVVDGLDRLPAQTRELLVYGGDKVVVAYEEDWPRGLELAYSFARARVLTRTASDSGVDVVAATDLIEQAVQQLDSVRQIKLQLTSIAGASEQSKKLLDDLARAVNERLQRAIEALC